MNVQFYTASREYQKLKNEIDAAVQTVCTKGDFILGEAVGRFEKNAAAYLQTKHAVGNSSGSEALLLGLHALNVKPGDEVITTPFSFFATVSSIVRMGARPVFIDIDPKTFNIDAANIEKAVTKKTKAILPVHLFLQTADMDVILDVAKRHSLGVLEDAAEAFGMEFNGKKAGTMGDIGIYSFYPTKTLGGYGDGGLLTTDNDELAARLKMLRVHGSAKRYYHDEVGYNSRLDSIQAAILDIKLKYIEKSIATRKEIGKKYTSLLKDVGDLELPYIAPNRREVYYVYSILTDKRDALAEYLKEKGVGTTIYYPLPLHMQKCFEEMGHKKGDFPNAEKTSERILALPIYPELGDDEIDYTISCVKEFFRK